MAGRVGASRVPAGVGQRGVAGNNDNAKIMMMSTIFVLSSATSVEDRESAYGGCAGV